jgi:hypothetical protein
MRDRLNASGMATSAIGKTSRTVLESPITKKLTRSFGSEELAAVPTPEQLDERAMTMASITALTQRATEALRTSGQPDPLPHPLVTDTNFSHYLDQATNSQASLQATASAPHAVLSPTAARQANLGEALIHCLHQLDHRTKAHDRRVRELEAELAEANRRLALLEGERRA